MARTSAYVEELSKSFATSLNAATESPALLLAFVGPDSYTIITPAMAFRRIGVASAWSASRRTRAVLAAELQVCAAARSRRPMELPALRPIGGLRLHSLVFVTNYQPSVVDVAAWSNPDSRVMLASARHRAKRRLRGLGAADRGHARRL